MKYIFGLAFALCASAQPALDRPVLGHMLDREGALRPVTGIGGNFQLDPANAQHVFATACSRDLCVAKTSSAILSGATVTPAPLGGALIALDGSAAVLYFPLVNQFVRWQDGALTPLDITVDGEMLALRSTNSTIELAVRRNSGVWLVSSDGTILDSLPSETSAVLLLPDSVVYSTANELVVRELHFTVAGITKLVALGDGYVEAMASSDLFALRTNAGREQLFVLPQAPGRARSIETR
jgi:hypothetical protein